MTTHPLTTASFTRITHRRAEDRASARAANALDAQAEALLRSDPALTTALSEAFAEVEARGARLRGLFQHALRGVARACAPTNTTARHAQAIHRQADALYWSMVLGWTGLINRQATFRSSHWLISVEEAHSRLALSWYEAALRFNPDHGIAYDRWALFNELAQCPCAGAPEPLIRTARNKTGKTKYGIVSLSGSPRSNDEDNQIRETLSDPADPVDEVVDQRIQLSTTINNLDLLTPRERHVVVERYFHVNADGSERTLAEVGRSMGLSRERTRQIEAMAIAKLRDAVAVLPRTATSPTTL